MKSFPFVFHSQWSKPLCLSFSYFKKAFPSIKIIEVVFLAAKFTAKLKNLIDNYLNIIILNRNIIQIKLW